MNAQFQLTSDGFRTRLNVLISRFLDTLGDERCQLELKHALRYFKDIFIHVFIFLHIDYFQLVAYTVYIEKIQCVAIKWKTII